MQKRPNASHKLQFLFCYILIRLFDLDVWQSRSTCCLISYETSITRSITLRRHKRIFCMAKIEWKNLMLTYKEYIWLFKALYFACVIFCWTKMELFSVKSSTAVYQFCLCLCEKNTNHNNELEDNRNHANIIKWTDKHA